jgi:hypothetical protein
MITNRGVPQGRRSVVVEHIAIPRSTGDLWSIEIESSLIVVCVEVREMVHAAGILCRPKGRGRVGSSTLRRLWEDGAGVGPLSGIVQIRTLAETRDVWTRLVATGVLGRMGHVPRAIRRVGSPRQALRG